MNGSKLFRAIIVLIATAASGTSIVEAKEFRLGLITPPPHIWTKAAGAFGRSSARRPAARTPWRCSLPASSATRRR